MLTTRKYRPYLSYMPVHLPDRTWPDRQITTAPIWCSVDLRDGNQALVNPMDVDRKLELFRLLVGIGFKEIEIGFPSAAQVEFEFTRTLIEHKLIPDDVVPQVLTQARANLIERTFESLQGAKSAILHIYNSTSELQRRVVFKKNRDEIVDIAVSGVRRVKELADQTDTAITLEYSPESFTGTEMDYAVHICEAVMDVWQPTPQRKIILNLPATVEMATPNVYADQIEWFLRRVHNRESVILSLHTHNDRGCAVAATELALMAGADRVEGTLFGNGERTGNVDIVTLALNMYSQGLDPGLDLRDIPHIRRVAEKCTQMTVHERHPYAGELVFTAFSGSHQDAINKGFNARQDSKSELWEIPYLPIDPHDINRSYEAIVRINSQSGKGGAAFIVQQELGCEIPKAMHPELSAVTQDLSDRWGTEVMPSTVWATFAKEYLERTEPYKFVKFQSWSNAENSKQIECRLTVEIEGEEKCLAGIGNGPIDACANALLQAGCRRFKFEDYKGMKRGGTNAENVAFIVIEMEGGARKFGVGIEISPTDAAIKAMLSALNRTLGVVNPVHPDVVSYIMDVEFNYHFPPKMTAEFKTLVHASEGTLSSAMNPSSLMAVFQREYLDRTAPYKFLDLQSWPSKFNPDAVECCLTVEIDGIQKRLTATGNGPIDACANALIQGGCRKFELVDYQEHARSTGSDAEAVAFIQIEIDGGARKFGVGIDANTTNAAIRAMLSAVNRTNVIPSLIQIGAADLLESEFGCDMPKEMRTQFNSLVRQQKVGDAHYLPIGLLWDEFKKEYLERNSPYRFINFEVAKSFGEATFECNLDVEINGKPTLLTGSGRGPIDATTHALLRSGGPQFEILNYQEHARTAGSDAEAVAYIAVRLKDGHEVFGAGIDSNTEIAAVKAICSALNRAIAGIGKC